MRRISPFFIFLFILWGCDLDFYESEVKPPVWTPEAAVPIGYVEYTLSELIKESDSLVEIHEDENKFITLIYEQKLVSESASDFLGLVNQHFNTQFNLDFPPHFPDPIVLPDVEFTIEEILEFQYDAGLNTSIDSIIFNSGVLDIELNSTIKAEVEGEITFLNLLDNNNPLTIPINLTNYGGASISESVHQQLNAFNINLTDDIFRVLITLEIHTYGAPVSSSDQIDFTFDLTEISFNSFYGNAGTRILKIEDEKFTFDFFNEFDMGEIFFDDPRMIFTINNSFGIPVSIDFNGIYADDPEEGIIPLTGEIVEAPQLIGAPDYSMIGNTVTSTVLLDKTTSNFNEIVSALPTVLNMPLNAVTNPNGENQNFVLNDSRIDIDLRAELPLDLRVLDLKNDVIFEFESGDISEIDNAILRIRTVNGFPLKGNVRVTFRNEQEDLLVIAPNNDFSFPLFDGAKVGNDGIVVEPTTSVIDISLDRNQLNLIEQATEAKLEVILNTTDSESGVTVKLLSDYMIKVNLAINSLLTVDLGDDQ